MLYRFKKISCFSRYRRRHSERRSERLKRGRLDDLLLSTTLFVPSAELPNATLALAPFAVHGASLAMPLIQVDSEFMLDAA